MTKKHYQILGISLFSSLLLLAPRVLADEGVPEVAPVGSPLASEQPSTAEIASNLTDNSPLNQAITEATTAGITVVETEPQTFETTQEAQTNYVEQVEAFKEVVKDYQEAKAVYQKAEQDYQNYQKQEAAYQTELVKYQEYQKKVQAYTVEQKTYELAKARYDEDYQEALGNTTKTGHLPEVLAQNLIFRSEPNATQTFTGSIIPDDILDTVTKDGNGWMDPGTVTAYAPGQTVTTKGKWNTALMDIGDTVVVDYSGLEHSSYSGYQLKRVRYTYRLIDTSHYSGKVIFQAIADPTVTSYTHIYNKDGVTQSSFEMEMTVQFFDANDKEIVPSADNYALTSFASINSRNGEGEFVGRYTGAFLPINGSTITVKDDYALNYSDVRQESLSATWDSDTSPDAYIGAIVGKSTERIRFHFGNSKGFADWFAFNSDIKVKGGIVTPPTPPSAPTFMPKPVAPQKVVKPSVILTPIVLYHKNKVVPKPANPSKPKTSEQKVVITPTYQPQGSQVVPRFYTYAKPNFGRGQVISRQPVATYRLTPQAESNPDSSTKKSKPSSQKRDWFGENTGIVDASETDKAQTDLRQFIKEIGQKAKKKYGKDKQKINRDIALTLASPSYNDDFLQNLYNTFEGSVFNVPEKIKNTISDNHDKGNKIDFAHVMTTLASLEAQKYDDELMKYTASRSIFTPFYTKFPLPVILIDKFNTVNQKNIILQQNSLVGDLLTTMPESDVYTDMDAIILARHPKFKDLPLDERILAYYDQENLDQKRKDLFLEVYGMNRGKDKGEAQLASFMDVLFGFLTMGGVGALAYSIATKKNQNIGNNIHLLDKLLYDGNIDKFRKHPIKTTFGFVGQKVNKNVIQPIVKTVQKINNKVIKPVLQTVKKTTARVVKATKTFVTKTVPQTVNRVIVQPVKRAVQRTKQFVKRSVNRVVQPIKRFVKRVAPTVKRFARTMVNALTTVARQSFKPKKKAGRKRRR